MESRAGSLVCGITEQKRTQGSSASWTWGPEDKIGLETSPRSQLMSDKDDRVGV